MSCSLILLSGCAPFAPKPGMTVEDVSKAAYVPCDGSMNIDKKHIVFIKDHPQNPEVKIYKTLADVKYKRGTPECRKELYFYKNVLISEEELKELVVQYQAELKIQQEIQLAQKIKLENERQEAEKRKEEIRKENEALANIKKETAGRTLITTLFLQNENYIKLWQNTLRNRCLGDYLNSRYTKKDYFEKKLPKINKDLKACYKENYKEELNDFAIRSYADESVSANAQLMQIFSLFSGSRLPNSMKELSDCHETAEIVEVTNHMIIGITGYPQNGWCQKLK